MIQLNVVCRINEDKNFFFDLIYALHKLKEAGVTDIKLLFVGAIQSRSVYQGMQRLIKILNLEEDISFTKKSIRFDDLPSSVKEGYFLNFTIGNFMGYSSIESIKMGFKTILYNVTKQLTNVTVASIAQCADLTSLITLITSIHELQAETDRLILEDNLRMKNSFILNSNDKAFLRSVLVPNAGK